MDLLCTLGIHSWEFKNYTRVIRNIRNYSIIDRTKTKTRLCSKCFNFQSYRETFDGNYIWSKDEYNNYEESNFLIRKEKLMKII